MDFSVNLWMVGWNVMDDGWMDETLWMDGWNVMGVGLNVTEGWIDCDGGMDGM
jgi:hypothetical protein